MTRVSVFELETVAAFVIPRMKLKALKKYGLFNSFAQVHKASEQSHFVTRIMYTSM